MSDARDDELEDRVRAGDEAAFREFSERHAARLLVRIGQLMPAALHRKVAASDILQESLLTALERLQELRSRDADSLRRWLGRIVEFKVKEEVRRYLGTQQRRAQREVVLPESGLEGLVIPARDHSPSEVLMGDELGEAARRAWVRLPGHYREVLLLLQDEGVTMTEAGARLGRSPDAAGQLYARALARYAALLEQERGRP